MATASDDLVGRLIGGQFRIASQLGTGAMATIYRARDEKGAIDVAVKVIKPDIVKNKTATARFHREAKAASKLEHPGIVRMLAWGIDGEIPYIAMELVEGEDLFELLDRRGALTEVETIKVAVTLCGALHTAHRQGVVHRDLKPENIMVGGFGSEDPISIKILDFGIAKLVGPQGDMWGDETVPQVLTKVGSAVGTPSHMAPEQARGDVVDGRTDIYACGVLMYEMATGHLPFEGDNPLHVAIRQVRDPPPRPTGHVPHLNPDLEAIILRALEKEPASRYQSASDLQGALLAVLADIDPAHETALRDIPSEVDDDLQTMQRDIPPEVMSLGDMSLDEDVEQLTAQRPIPASLRGMIDKRTQEEPPTRQHRAPAVMDDDEDPLTNVLQIASSEAHTLDLDTVAGPTIKREVEARLRAAIDEAAAAPDQAPETADPTPFVDHEIEDEDSEGSIATVVAGPGNMSADAVDIVRRARAIANKGAGKAERRAALSITKQSDLGELATALNAPAVEVIGAAKSVRDEEPEVAGFPNAISPDVGSPNAGSPNAGSLNAGLSPPLPDPGVPESLMPPSRTSELPLPSIGPGPMTRGAANELEDLLKQMPAQRQPVVGSVIVLLFLAIAIAALIYLLVGAATF